MTWLLNSAATESLRFSRTQPGRLVRRLSLLHQLVLVHVSLLRKYRSRCYYALAATGIVTLSNK
jgi:hypothetical protein